MMIPRVAREHARWLPDYACENPEARLDPETIAPAAKALGIPAHNIHAVIMKESSGDGFGDDGKATILYEPHIFSRYTQHRFDQDYPSISYRRWKPPNRRDRDHAYNTTQEQRWGMLLFAASLDYVAAVKACSWGLFQVMGFNYELSGCDHVTQFVRAMHVSEQRQFQLWLVFLEQSDLLEPLKKGDWLAFALGYNMGRNWRDPAQYRNAPTVARRYAAACARYAAECQSIRAYG